MIVPLGCPLIVNWILFVFVETGSKVNDSCTEVIFTWTFSVTSRSVITIPWFSICAVVGGIGP